MPGTTILRRILATGLAGWLWTAAGGPPTRVHAQADSSPQRLVSLVPSVTEMLFAIGAGPRVVGVSSFDHEPPAVAQLPRVGGLVDPDLERIFSLRPDLVIVYASQDDLRMQITRAGIEQFPYTNTDLAGIGDTMRALGARLGLETSAEDAASRFESRLAALGALMLTRSRPTTLLVFAHDPGSLRGITATGGDGFHHDMLVLAGARNALREVGRPTVEMTVESVLRLAPEVILDLHYGDSSISDAQAETRLWDAMPTVPAVRNGRVYVLQGDEFVVPGPRVADATEQIARTLHPNAFR